MRALCTIFTRLYRHCTATNWPQTIADDDWRFALLPFSSFARPRYTDVCLDTNFATLAVESLTTNFNQLLFAVWPTLTGVANICPYELVDAVAGCIATNVQLYTPTHAHLQASSVPMVCGMFPYHACINHSCAPNARICTLSCSHPIVNAHKNALFIQATTDIRVNDEIFISYLAGSLDTHPDQRFKWNCTCGCCSDSS
uniref:Histone-lysine N-methyltransferase ASHR1 n=1 Tax=Lygus hesperus TaxID=30085 RepID=A0A0A9YUX9_LYGHE